MAATPNPAPLQGWEQDWLNNPMKLEWISVPGTEGEGVPTTKAMRSLTAEEKKVAEILGWAFNAFSKLPQIHPADLNEFATACHQAQNIVLARPGTEVLAQEAYGLPNE